MFTEGISVESGRSDRAETHWSEVGVVKGPPAGLVFGSSHHPGPILQVRSWGGVTSLKAAEGSALINIIKVPPVPPTTLRCSRQSSFFRKQNPHADPLCIKGG